MHEIPLHKTWFMQVNYVFTNLVEVLSYEKWTLYKAIEPLSTPWPENWFILVSGYFWFVSIRVFLNEESWCQIMF